MGMPSEGLVRFARLPRVEVFGLDFDQIDETGVIDHVFGELEQGRGGWMVTPNLHILRESAWNPEVAQLIGSAPLVVMDGAPVEWAGKLSRRTRVGRVPGSTVFWSLVAAASDLEKKVLLMGGRIGSAEIAAARLRAMHPDIVVESHFPPFGFESDPSARNDILDAVRQCEGGLVFVGLGCPKQERLMAELSELFPSTWFFGVGAAIDFASGQVKRAPEWMQKAGLEWSHRLMTEPHRLARRYLVDDLPFAVELARWAMGARYARLAGGDRTPLPAGSVLALGSSRETAPLSLADALAQASIGPSPAAKTALRTLSDPATSDISTRAQALDALVDLLRREGKSEECAHLLQQRLSIPFDSPTRRVHAQMQLARFLMESGRLYDAVDSAAQSVVEAERSGTAETLEGVKLRATLAELLRLRGDLISAELQIGLALVTADRLGDPAARGSAAWNASLISADQGRSEEALDWARTAGDIFREAGQHLPAALVGVVEAMIQLDSPGGEETSVKRLEAALEVVRAEGTASQEGLVFMQMARLDLRRGEIEHAQGHIQMALAQLGDANVIDTATALSIKAQILAVSGEQEAAYEAAKAASSTLARVGAERMAESIWADLNDISRLAGFMPPEIAPTGGVTIPMPRKITSARHPIVIPGAPS